MNSHRDAKIDDYLSWLLWKKKYEDEIKRAREMSLEERFNMLIELNVIGEELINANDKEKKLELRENDIVRQRKRLKDFIECQLRKCAAY